MQSNLNIIGDESSVIFYNLNKQYSNVNKIIITKDILLNSFENDDIKNLFAKLKVSNLEENLEILTDLEKNKIIESKIVNDLYNLIQEQLPKISKNLMDVKLKEFNFMNSLSNSNLSVTIRCENFSISKHNNEKGNLLSSIKHLLVKYLENKINILRLPRLDNFQIEVYESEEIHKKILLKKENENLSIYSTFGYVNSKPFDYKIGGEIYFSIGEDFSFFKNNQNKAFVKEHGKIVEREINPREKILNNNELIAINKITKNINDALIEIYINSKGGIKILNVSLLESGLNNKSDNGFIIHKSTNNIDTISTVTLRDNLDDEYLNPKYLILRNEGEVKEFLDNLNIVNKVDGIIFTINFYSEILDLIGNKLNLDILYFNKNIQKVIETKIDFENVDIQTNNENKNINNPFSSIIKDNQKEKDLQFERLKNIDLSTPVTENNNNNNNNNIKDLAQSIISSNNSSINNNNRQMNTNNPNDRNSIASSLSNTMGGSNSGEKKTALQLMMEIAANEKAKPQTQQQSQQQPQTLNNLYGETKTEQVQNTQSRNDEFFNMNRNSREEQMQRHQSQINSQRENNNVNYNNNNNQQNSYNNSHQFGDLTNNYENQPQPQTNNILNKQNLNIIEEQTQTNIEIIEEKIDVNKYNEVLSTKILTVPNVQSNHYFVDINTISMVQGGEIFYLTTDINEINNPNMKFILPLELYKNGVNVDYLLINSTNEYFLLNEDTKDKNIFINLSRIDGSIKKQFLEHAINEIGKVSLILLKENLYLIEKYINRIENIMIKDINSDYEFQEIKNQILGFEKKFLMNKFN